MDIVVIILLGVVASLLFIVVKEVQPSFAFLIILITATIILITVIKQLHIIITLIKSLANQAQINSYFLEIVLKIIGIAYITEIAANLTKDAGLNSVATNIELAGKISIIILAIPIITAIIETILQLLPFTDATIIVQ